MKTVQSKRKNHPKCLQVGFLPYVSLKDDLKIGNVLLWSFYQKKDKYISDEVIKSQIERFLKQYVENSKGREFVKNVTIISYKTTNNFNPLTPKQLRDVKDAATMLFFSTIIRNTNSWAFSSDNFQPICQNFVPGDDLITPTSGSYRTRSVAGLKIEDALFITPFYISHGSDICYDEKFLRALEKLQQDRNNQKLYRRIMTSLEWVAYADTNVNNFNRASRIVMMATAFEILLNGFKDRFDFMKKIKKRTCNDLDDLTSHPFYRYRRMRSTRKIHYNWRKQSKNFSFKEWWAYEFYVLRNRIVHGERIKSKDFVNRKGEDYFLLSIQFFEECLKKLLAEKKYYSYDVVADIWTEIYDKI